MSSRDVLDAFNRPLPPEGITRTQWDALIGEAVESVLEATAERIANVTAWNAGLGTTPTISKQTRTRCWAALKAVTDAGAHPQITTRIIRATQKLVRQPPSDQTFDEYVSCLADQLSNANKKLVAFNQSQGFSYVRERPIVKTVDEALNHIFDGDGLHAS